MECSKRIEIPSWALDDFARQHGVDHVDLMKLDIEGSEAMALLGARSLFLERKISTVVCEFNPYWLPRMDSSVEELYEIFEAFSMDVFFLTRFSRLRRINRDFCRRATSEFDAVAKMRGTA